MIAVFNEQKFVALFHEPSLNDGQYVPNLIRALGLDLKKTSIYKCPPLRNDESYFFEEKDGKMNLVKVQKETLLFTPDDGEPFERGHTTVSEIIELEPF